MTRGSCHCLENTLVANVPLTQLPFNHLLASSVEMNLALTLVFPVHRKPATLTDDGSDQEKTEYSQNPAHRDTLLRPSPVFSSVRTHSVELDTRRFQRHFPTVLKIGTNLYS
jgi:hypothetical protein